MSLHIQKQTQRNQFRSKWHVRPNFFSVHVKVKINYTSNFNIELENILRNYLLLSQIHRKNFKNWWNALKKYMKHLYMD
jgi:hypothetical protein